VPHLATYADASIGAETWLWDFGDGFTSTDTNATHTYTATGDYTVSLEVSNANGCIASELASVVIPELNADFSTPDTLGCFSLTSSFSDSSTFNYTPSLTSYDWYFGDGYYSPASSPAHLYQDTGVYDVKLRIVDYYGCVDSLIIPGYIRVNGVYPEFSWDLTQGCAPLKVNFVDSSAGSLPIDTWMWDFGDGSPIGNTQDTSYTYTNSGIYSVQLTVSDSNGCSSSVTYPNLVYASRPSPSFSYKPIVCANEDIGILNNSSGDGISYSWNFGDGNIDSVANPLHGYADTGIYVISLVVTDSNGCDSTMFAVVNVEPPPIAGMILDTVNTNCPPLVVSFQDSSLGSVTSWFWDFGDGATSANEDPIHTYSYPDTFDVMLIVSNVTACSDTLVMSSLIKIGGPYGSFAFDPDSGCVPLDVSFQANAYNTSTYVWDFGDGFIDSVSGSTAQRTYINVGTPHPALILVDSLDCQLPAQLPSPDSLLIDDPVASFGSSTSLIYSTLCGLDTVYFFDSSTVLSPYTSIVSWDWDFGDGGSDTVPNPLHVYADTGSYTVVLQVANTLGCVKYDTLVIEVELDTVNILTVTVPVYSNVLCGGGNTGTATGSALGGTAPYTYLWSDDSAQTTVQCTGLTAGVYTLWVTDLNGCIDSAAVVIGEPATLIADILDSSMVTCNGFTDGTAEAIGYGGTGAYTYQWDDPGSQTSAIATGLDADTLVVTVSDSMGCAAQDSVLITQPDTIVLGNGGQTNVTCFGGTDGVAIATTAGGTPPYSYLWSTVPAQTDTVLDSLIAGNYTITVQDSFNCNTGLSFNITEPAELYAQVIDTTSIECYGEATGAILIGVYGGTPLYSIDWPGVGDTGVAVDSLLAGTYNYNITDSSGCTYSDNVTLGQPDVIVVTINVGDGVICTYVTDSVQATAIGGTPPLTYNWNQGLGSGSSWKLLTPDSTSTYHLDVADANNCNVQDSVQIIVYDLISVGMWADTVCVGDSTALEVYITEGMDSSYVYVWDFGDGVIDTTAATNASHVYTDIGSSLIDLTVIGPDACVTDSLVFDILTVSPSPVASFSASTYSTTTANPSISFADESLGSLFGDAISFLYWDFGDQTYSDYTNPSHLYQDSGTYTVTHSVVNGKGCTDTIRLDIRIDPSFDIEVPNAFTPDPNGGNGGTYVAGALDNNIFYPITKFVEEFHMAIFNRWGEMVFESQDLAIGWDGYYRGVLSQQDVYVWKVEVRYIDGSVYQQIGDVTLVR
jgi:PKD repeat protein